MGELSRVLVLVLVLLLTPSVSRPAASEGEDGPPGGTHVPLTLLDGRLQAGTREAAEEIADPTGYCSSCHDEQADGQEIRALPHGEGSAARDHPVDVAYPASDPDYRDPLDLEPALLLLDGRLTCVSCHAHADPEHVLVLTTENSEICRACHLM